MKLVTLNIDDFPKWTKGLPIMIARALLNAGYTSKKDVISGLKSKEVNKVRNIGKLSLVDISRWAGIMTPRQAEIAIAIALLEHQGYTVTKNCSGLS